MENGQVITVRSRLPSANCIREPIGAHLDVKIIFLRYGSTSRAAVEPGIVSGQPTRCKYSTKELTVHSGKRRDVVTGD